MENRIREILQDYMTERQIELALPRLVNLISVNVPVISSVAVPEWLSTQHRIDMIKELWNEPNINNSNPRVKAIQLAKSFAKEYGYEIDIKKATEVIRQHCL